MDGSDAGLGVRTDVLDDRLGDVRTFDHAFQSGFHEGWIEVDGVRTEVSGWTGQRDRSRGKRHITARQGIHEQLTFGGR